MAAIDRDETCIVMNVINSREVEAVVMEFIDKKRLLVVLNKSVKLSMTWNGQQYEGRGAGMDFLSNGPVLHKGR